MILTTNKGEKMNWKIFVIAGGFYYFGEEVDSGLEGYVAMKNASMFGGFSGGKGLPGLARGDSSMTVNLDRFLPDEKLIFPTSCCYGILPTIDLYKFKGTNLR